MTDKEDRFMQWLRDAHAMEMQGVTMLERQAQRIAHYPALKTRLEQHAKETRDQAELVKDCIERSGGRISVAEDLGAQAFANMQNIGGLFAGDEVVKDTLTEYAFEHLEIAAYRALCAAAEDIGDSETQIACQKILKQEEDMASWLGDYLPNVTQYYLHREAANVQSKL